MNALCIGDRTLQDDRLKVLTKAAGGQGIDVPTFSLPRTFFSVTAYFVSLVACFLGLVFCLSVAINSIEVRLF
jgi:hypothetical protein